MKTSVREFYEKKMEKKLYVGTYRCRIEIWSPVILVKISIKNIGEN